MTVLTPELLTTFSDSARPATEARSLPPTCYTDPEFFDFEKVNGAWLISHLRLVHTFVAPYEEGWLKTKYVSPVTLMKISRV